MASQVLIAQSTIEHISQEQQVVCDSNNNINSNSNNNNMKLAQSFHHHQQQQQQQHEQHQHSHMSHEYEQSSTTRLTSNEFFQQQEQEQDQQQQQQQQPQPQQQQQLNQPKARGRKRKIRTEPIRPICPQCEKQFSNQSALTKHKLTHSDERKFACHQCSKAFKRHDHLTGHMQTHSNRKPYNCNIQGCDKTYCDARSLRRHKENIHHIVTPKQDSNSGSRHFSFDFEIAPSHRNEQPVYASTNSIAQMTPHSADSVTDSGLSLNVQYEQQPINSTSNLNHYDYRSPPLTAPLIPTHQIATCPTVHESQATSNNLDYQHQQPYQYSGATNGTVQQQQHHHQPPHSADYASTCHFSFDFKPNEMRNHPPIYTSTSTNNLNTQLPPHSADSITDSGLSLNVQYEHQPINSMSNLHHYDYRSPPLTAPLIPTHQIASSATVHESQAASNNLDYQHQQPYQYSGATNETVQQQQHHHQPPHSADYASTCHFSFDFDPNEMRNHPPIYTSTSTNNLNTQLPPHSADSVTNNGLSSNVHYERQVIPISNLPQQNHQATAYRHSSMSAPIGVGVTHHQPSHLLQRRIQRLHSDQGTTYSEEREPPVTLTQGSII